MKFGIDISGQLKKMTGIQHYVDSLLCGLYDLRTEHEIIPFVPTDERRLEVADYVEEGLFTWLRNAAVQSPRKEFTLGHQPYIQARPGLQALASGIDGKILNRYKNVTRNKRLNRMISSFDLVHVPEAGLLDFTRYKCRHSTITIHDLTTVLMAAKHRAGSAGVWEQYYRFAADKCDRVIAVSEHTKRDIVEHLGISADRIDVTPLAPRMSAARVCDPAQWKAAHEKFDIQDRPFVLYAGTLEPRKNLMRLVEAFAQVVKAEKMPEHRLVLAGGNWERHDLELRLRAYEIGIGEQVITTGYVSNAEMNALMSSCAAFAYVSEYEGFGLPPLEAMVCGAPVVSSNTSSLPEVVGEAGIQVNPLDVGAIAEALHLLLTDEGENSRRRMLSLARAGEFSWERTARLTLQSYEAAVA